MSIEIFIETINRGNHIVFSEVTRALIVTTGSRVSIIMTETGIRIDNQGDLAHADTPPGMKDGTEIDTIIADMGKAISDMGNDIRKISQAIGSDPLNVEIIRLCMGYICVLFRKYQLEGNMVPSVLRSIDNVITVKSKHILSLK